MGVFCLPRLIFFCVCGKKLGSLSEKGGERKVKKGTVLAMKKEEERHEKGGEA